MFTGIVGLVRPLVRYARQGAVRQLWLDLEPWCADLELGESICVSGACLTVANVAGSTVRFDLSPETAGRTRFDTLATGELLNLERALRLSDRLGGHLVTGHIDGCGRYLSASTAGDGAELRFEVPPELERYLVSKGSIAVEGVSLTIAAFESREFTVAVVPHTLGATSLGSLRPGASVHLEADLIGKWIERLLPGDGPAEKPSLGDVLRQSGFWEG